jgi:caa(3)-type oxidase subunit IV
MAEHAHAESHSHSHPNYIRIWAILLLLLVVSVAGPMLGVKWVTLVTAFGIAVVKAYLVAKNFMHVNIEKRFVVYALLTVLVFMLLFFSAVAPDVMKKDGTGWEKPSWKTHAPAAPAAEHGGAH